MMTAKQKKLLVASGSYRILRATEPDKKAGTVKLTPVLKLTGMLKSVPEYMHSEPVVFTPGEYWVEDTRTTKILLKVTL